MLALNFVAKGCCLSLLSPSFPAPHRVHRDVPGRPGFGISPGQRPYLQVTPLPIRTCLQVGSPSSASCRGMSESAGTVLSILSAEAEDQKSKEQKDDHADTDAQ